MGIKAEFKFTKGSSPVKKKRSKKKKLRKKEVTQNVTSFFSFFGGVSLFAEGGYASDGGFEILY